MFLALALASVHPPTSKVFEKARQIEKAS